MSDYYSYFPKISYDGVIVPDVFRRAKIAESVKTNASYYSLYIVNDGETPDIVAYNVYRNPNLYWLVCLTNNIINPQFDWVMSSNELDELVDKKYGVLNSTALHHYETTGNDVLGRGITVDADYAGVKRGITNYEFEQRINESKRSIKIVRAEYLNAVLDDFKAKMYI